MKLGKKLFFYSFGRGPFINLTNTLSISFLNSFEGRGRIVAICVNFARRHVLVMFTLAVIESLVVDQIPISVFMAFIAFSQFKSNLSRFPVKYIPKSLNGLGSMEKLVRA